MKIKQNILALLILLAPISASADAIGKVEITGNQAWDAASYEISGIVHINAGSRLDISPQSNLSILPGGQFNVNGELHINGSSQASISVQTLTGSKSTPAFNV